MLFNRVHVPVKGGDGLVTRMDVNPYIWLGSPNGTLVLKDGGVYSAGGDPIPIEDVTDEQWAQINALSVQARESVGFAGRKPEPKAEPKVNASAKK